MVLELCNIWIFSMISCRRSIAANLGTRAAFVRTDTKLCFLVITLPIKGNSRLLQQVKTISKNQVNGVNIDSEWKIQKLDYLIDPSFQKVNRPFANQSFKFIAKDGFKIVNQIHIKKITDSSLKLNLKSKV